MQGSLSIRSRGSSTPPPNTAYQTPIRTVRVPQFQVLPPGVPPPPTALETEDYYGLWRNQPRLVARSNYPDDQWSCLCNNWSQVEASHPLRELMATPDRILQRELASALEYTQWESFETVRIGSALQQSQVKLLIVVKTGSTSWSHAWIVARVCRNILRSYTIMDVEVEVQECAACWVVMQIRESVGPEVTIQDCTIGH